MTAPHHNGEPTLFIRDSLGEYYGLPMQDLAPCRLSEQQAEALETELAQRADEVSGYMPIYLQHQALTGEVTEPGHLNWIQISSFQWGVGRGISSPTGGSADRAGSAPSVSEIHIHKP